MMRHNTGYNAARYQRFDGVILTIKKNHSSYQIMTVFTLQQGWFRVFLNTSRKHRNQGIGSLSALSIITFDAWERGGSLTLGEYECVVNTLISYLTVESYAYAQICIEMVLHLIPEKAADRNVYGLLCRYSKLVGEKNERILTVITGWQLVALAGFCPDIDTVHIYRKGITDTGRPVYYLSEEPEPALPAVMLPLSVQQLWKTILAYDWNAAQPLQISKRAISFLEELLYSYVQQCTEQPLRAVDFLYTIETQHNSRS
ncbi:MAG: DNA repair protein RecO C-terminal domain-containing protein [Megasphaera sp.]|nr:DNA repair protein RecO C-terminal domain-containing protein [Megasphaera sp.]